MSTPMDYTLGLRTTVVPSPKVEPARFAPESFSDSAFSSVSTARFLFDIPTAFS